MDTGTQHTLAASTLYLVECFDRNGNLKWVEEVPNTVVNAGLDDLLDKYFKGSSYTAAHYVGLINDPGSPAISIAAGDTMSSHSGWTEDQNYSESNRQDLTLGSVSGQSVDNSASKAAFSINGTTTIGGAFVTTDNTKGGTAGTLYGAATFSSSRSVENGDTLNVTTTLTAASS